MRYDYVVDFVVGKNALQTMLDRFSKIGYRLRELEVSGDGTYASWLVIMEREVEES